MQIHSAPFMDYQTLLFCGRRIALYGPVEIWRCFGKYYSVVWDGNKIVAVS